MGHRRGAVAELSGSEGRMSPTGKAIYTKVRGSMDAEVWAKAFIEQTSGDPALATDMSTVRAWFAFALMLGYDTRRNEEAPRNACKWCGHDPSGAL